MELWKLYLDFAEQPKVLAKAFRECKVNLRHGDSDLGNSGPNVALL